MNNRNDLFCSFENFKPFKQDGYPKTGVYFAEWAQSKTRTAIMAYGKNVDAFWFYTDDNLTLEDARVKLGGVEVLSQEEYEKMYSEWVAKTAIKINRQIDTFWASHQPADILAAKVPCFIDDMRVDLSEAPATRFTEKGFLKSPVSRIHCGEYLHLKITRQWGEFDYFGTGAYIRGELTSYPVLNPSEDFKRVAEQRYGLKAIKSPLAPLLPLTDKSAFSLFGWSVSGGVGCSDVAINVASGAVVPLDDGNDLSHHKMGWSYAHKYMGSHGNTGEIVIMRKHGALDFGLGDELIESIGGGSKTQGVAKLVKYLCALMVFSGWNPSDALTIHAGNEELDIWPQEVLSQC